MSPSTSAHNTFLKEGVILPTRNSDFFHGASELLSQKSEDYMDLLILTKPVVSGKQLDISEKERVRDRTAQGFIAYRGSEEIQLF